MLIESWQQKHPEQAPNVLILGVTPEYVHLPWPEGSRLHAIDRTEAMIRHVWPGAPSAVTQADWLEMPFAARAMDIVLCDGGLHLLGYPDEQRALIHHLARILRPGGACLFRLFVPPERPESPDAVLEALLQGQIENLNCLKLRLGMALQGSAEQGVQLDDVWRAVHAVAPDLDILAAQLGWASDHLAAINAYRDSPARYCFVTFAQARRLFLEGAPPPFTLQGVATGSYLMADQCPTILLRRCGS